MNNDQNIFHSEESSIFNGIESDKNDKITIKNHNKLEELEIESENIESRVNLQPAKKIACLKKDLPPNMLKDKPKRPKRVYTMGSETRKKKYEEFKPII